MSASIDGMRFWRAPSSLFGNFCESSAPLTPPDPATQHERKPPTNPSEPRPRRRRWRRWLCPWLLLLAAALTIFWYSRPLDVDFEVVRGQVPHAEFSHFANLDGPRGRCQEVGAYN